MGIIDDERGVRASEIERRGARGARRLYLIEEASDQETSDARITEADRQLVRRLVAKLESIWPAEVLMYLSGGVEAAAWRKRAAERGST